MMKVGRTTSKRIVNSNKRKPVGTGLNTPSTIVLSSNAHVYVKTTRAQSIEARWQETAGPKALFLEAIHQFSPENRRKLQKACEIVSTLHETQTRPDGEPYANHVLRVAERIISKFGVSDTEVVTAGLFHDAVEDQADRLVGHKNATQIEALDLLETMYSKRTRLAIEGVTKPDTLDAIADKEVRNKAYVDHVIEVCENNPDSFIVKLSDFFDNAMRLANMSSHPKILSSAKKYLPLFDYFIEAIPRHSEVSQDKKAELIAEITEQKFT